MISSELVLRSSEFVADSELISSCRGGRRPHRAAPAGAAACPCTRAQRSRRSARSSARLARRACLVEVGSSARRLSKSGVRLSQSASALSFAFKTSSPLVAACRRVLMSRCLVGFQICSPLVAECQCLNGGFQILWTDLVALVAECCCLVGGFQTSRPRFPGASEMRLCLR